MLISLVWVALGVGGGEQLNEIHQDTAMLMMIIYFNIRLHLNEAGERAVARGPER